jgi:NAD(P)-dependent dehydrogenase (short-subunit alcohol dehydrogenase family)
MSIAVVTGSASGIGLAVRERLAANGDRIIGVDLRDAEVQADLSVPEGRAQAVSEVLEQSEGEIDRLVLCAGLGSHLEDLALIASVNYFGAVDVMDGLRPALESRPDSAAVAICSNSAQMSRGFEEHPFVIALLDHDEDLARELVAKENGFVAYGGSKHALSRAVRRRAGEWGKAGVRLNGIAPGTTETPLLQGTIDHPVYSKGLEQLEVPIGRRAVPSEMAGIIAFLLSDEAGYIHGSILFADGGTDAVIRPDRF